MGSLFDQFLGDYDSVSGPAKPFWSLDFDDRAEVLKWCNEELMHLQNQAVERINNQMKNLAIFRGIQYQARDRSTRQEQADDNIPARRSRNPRVVYNHMVDMVEQYVARLTKYRGAVAARPPSEDWSDRCTAEIADKAVESYWDKVDIDRKMQKMARKGRIFGEDYMVITWNRAMGPYDMDYLSEVFKIKGIKQDPASLKPHELVRLIRDEVGTFPKIPMVDSETGETIKGMDGKPIWITKPVRQGDVYYRPVTSWDMLLQRKRNEDLVEYGMFREVLPVDTVRAMHPDLAEEIFPDGDYNVPDPDTYERVHKGNTVEVWHLYHKSTDMLDQGRYVKFTRQVVLTNKPNPYFGWDYRAILPWVRFADIDTPEVINGDATVTHGRGPQAVYNNLISLRVRNRFMFSHPKWFYPQNSVTKESLTNSTTLVQYKGPLAPQLSQPAINEANETSMMDQSKNDLQQIMGVYGVSRGDPPAGVTAAVALTYLDEQENERANIATQNYTRALKDIALQTLWIMGDHYSDQQIADLLGKEHLYMLKDWKVSNLRSINDLRIQNMSALPQQKSARMQYVLDIRERAPNVINDEQMIDLLELGEVERFRSAVTSSSRKAQLENNRMSNGEMMEPAEQENHLTHYKVHLMAMNDPSYIQWTPEAKQYVTDHVMATEMLMYDIAARNPIYLQMIMAEYPSFPVFFKPEEVGMAPLPPPGMPPMGPGMPPPGPMMPPDQMPMPTDLMATPAMEGVPPGAEAISPTENQPL